MKNINNRYTSLAIIGNGFDLAHGYKTSYGDFTSAIGEEFFSEYKNYLNTYCDIYGEWNDFEKQVEALTASFYQKVMSNGGFDESFIRQFNTNFLSIKEKLIDYLQTEIEKKPFYEIESIRKVLGKNVIGLNFNYTNTAENYICDIMYVHGSLKENEIVLGYDPVDPFCFPSYENRKWFKQICRERLAFLRYIKEELHIYPRDLIYKELCEEYEQIQRLQNSGKGLEPDDIFSLKQYDLFNKYITNLCNDDVFEQNISFESINKVVVLGHSIKSDETYLKKIFDKCPYIQQVILFSHKSEKRESWESKVEFLRNYCTNIEKESY